MNILEEYKRELPLLEEQSAYYFTIPELRDAWLITETRVQEYRKIIERLENG